MIWQLTDDKRWSALRQRFSWVEEMHHTPQDPEHHGEGDVGVHTEMVLNALITLPEFQQLPAQQQEVLWAAALLHDVGKGTTPPEEWPHHYGHEERGARLIEPLAERLRLPQDFRDLAVMSARWHGHVHKVLEMRPTTVLKVLEALDALRRPQRFEHVLLVCEADARGRLGFEDCAYPQADVMRRALAAIKAVSVQPLLAQGLSGAALGQALARARLQALTESAFKTQVSA